MLQAQVVFTMVLARLALDERSTRRQIIGAVIGTAGLVVVAVAHGSSAPVLPLLVTLGAAVSWAIGNVVSRAARVSSGLSLVVWSALVVPVPAFVLSLLLDGPAAVEHTLGHLPPAAILSTAYTVFGASLLGYVVWNSLLARYPAGAVVPYVLLVPPVGILTAWLVQGEQPTALELVGGAVMLVGVAAATISRRPPVTWSGRSGGQAAEASTQRSSTAEAAPSSTLRAASTSAGPIRSSSPSSGSPTPAATSAAAALSSTASRTGAGLTGQDGAGDRGVVRRVGTAQRLHRRPGDAEVGRVEQLLGNRSVAHPPDPGRPGDGELVEPVLAAEDQCGPAAGRPGRRPRAAPSAGRPRRRPRTAAGPGWSAARGS